MIAWPIGHLLNFVYALLAERADARDNAERPLYAGDFSKDDRESLCRHREEFDAWLIQPIGKQAAAEKALLRELGAA